MLLSCRNSINTIMTYHMELHLLQELPMLLSKVCLEVLFFLFFYFFKILLHNLENNGKKHFQIIVYFAFIYIYIFKKKHIMRKKGCDEAKNIKLVMSFCFLTNFVVPERSSTMLSLVTSRFGTVSEFFIATSF